MREFLKTFKESIKTGIVLLIIAYLLLAVICGISNEMDFYIEQINKLHDPINFAMQLTYAGLAYTALVFTFKVFVDNLLRAVAKNDKKRAVANALAVAVIIIIVCVVSYYMKEVKIVNKNIIKLMFVVLMLEAIVFIIKKMVDNTVYNNKLKEKNKE
jgi:Kef-type K+ transport system membrane component KefB